MLRKIVSHEEANNLIELLRKSHSTKSTAVKTDVLLKNHNLGYSPRHLRAIVEFIRQNDLAAPSYLVSNTKVGYWLTSDTAEMKSFLDQELDRVSNQVTNINALRMRLITPKQKKQVEQLHIF
ncbi:hypothetical protein [Pedobacter ureilyticus]|uniref:Uncharacterized protein n=1 Tax=Pedobacter ureilyticus TaxID=1393051 RepID=A0ABW9J1Q7_9SPHI|nr:hypothetical protein [Pedobacter helvus]